MQPCYAVVDLETTGNQLETDAIIQIGITFVRNNEIIDTYHSMVNTDIEIPPFIQALTAIEQEMIDQAPYFKDIAQTVHAKLQDCTFVAHNVAFDLNFIQRAFKDCHITYKPKKVLDTLELFKIAFPTDKSYQLSELAERHNIDLAHAHRADEDATTTAQLMITAFQKLEQLPVDTLKQIYYLSKNLKYDLHDIIFNMVRHSNQTTISKNFEQFEQVLYRKQVDFKAPSKPTIHSLKSLYEQVTAAIDLTYRPQQ